MLKIVCLMFYLFVISVRMGTGIYGFAVPIYVRCYGHSCTNCVLSEQFGFKGGGENRHSVFSLLSIVILCLKIDWYR